MNTATNDNGNPYTVSIVCMGPSHRDYLDHCIGGVSRFSVSDETWAVNAMAGIIEHDRAFIMDDLQYFAKQARDDKRLAGYKDWLHKANRPPIYTSRAHPDFPSSIDYPLEEVVNKLGFAYFNTTVAYAVAFAIAIEVREMRLYGMDFTDKANQAFSEAGRACVEFWVGRATLQGIKVSIAPNSSLCDQAAGRQFYGYSIQPTPSK